MTNVATLGYWADAPGRGSVRSTTLRDAGPDDLRLQALCTGVSPGTERLVGLGRVPATMDATMAVPGMQGSFALPILYGYSFVGRVVGGARAGERVFTMHPHTADAVVAAAACVPLPVAVPDARATLFPNLETALNAVWDAAPAPGERIVVVGGGAVGLLVTFVLAVECGVRATLVEADPVRRRFAAALPWQPEVVAPEAAPREAFACALHASGTGSGLQFAIDLVGFEGRVVDLSWYGDQPVSLRLGETFHHRRKSLRASQVATIAPARRAAGRAARTAAVLALLRDDRLDALVRDRVPFDRLPDLFARLHHGEPAPACPVVEFATGRPVGVADGST
ncbi:MAG: zinc-binding alcohol dehydrogenase [Planctomycetes bacterium]|nr:zinc-binding alcohol dehydrogenase [Planctomycetota bacterium]